MGKPMMCQDSITQTWGLDSKPKRNLGFEWLYVQLQSNKPNKASNGPHEKRPNNKTVIFAK